MISTDIDPNQSHSRKITHALALACGALPGLFLLITSTTFLFEGQFVYDVKRLLQLCLMLVLFLAAGLNRGLRDAFAVQFGRIPGWVKSLLGLIIVFGIISSMVNATSGMHLAYSLLEVALLSMLVLAVLVIAACRAVAGELFDQVAITLLAMTAIAVGIQEVLGVAAALANDLEFYFRISLMHFSWPRFYNQVQAWTLPVLAALPLVWSRSRSEVLQSNWFQALVCLSALALHWYIILMTGGRGAAVSLLVSFLICLLIFPATRGPFLRWHVPGLIVAALLFFAIAQLSQQTLLTDASESTASTAQPAQQDGVNPRDLFEKQKDQTRFARQSIAGRMSLDSSGRLSMWRDSMHDIEAHPLLGNGPMNYACTGPEYRAGHPHSFALQFAGEWGLPATLALSAVLAMVAFVLWKHLHAPAGSGIEARLGTPLAIGLIAAAGYSCLSGVMVMPASQVVGMLIGGWLMGLLRIDAREHKPKNILAPIFLSTGILVSLTATSFSFMEAGKREYRESIIKPLDWGIPRYWQQGKLCQYFDDF